MRVGPFMVSDVHMYGDKFSYSNNLLKYHDYSFHLTKLFIQSIKRKND